MIAFVSGGARSGKSAVAERLTLDWQQRRGGPCFYLATATASDSEMAARIERHRRERGSGWTTREAPLALGKALAEVPVGATVLLDCLTLWASRALYEAGFDEEEGCAELAELLLDAGKRQIALVVVSNDLNEDLPPRDAETWRYLAFLQRLHRQLAMEADRVVEVVAGMAIEWKTDEEPAP
ncbi:bifunctional adenosylcobinamide kinase/adenosylcobinamide-phosphate guanylyltransferase [Billgrantia montanilacus]|uniref:Bifunctional adenosylcobalamin biosynthesis protein n=1 Tax=Billgrantia montanilacus TaxID=2282305 RepID=A0A368U826_9GAMM|nr:bifunctional adenosylcobinamide kinase/adenosylcobinamide-phosphate guanylyltransferase [Halomonas montanilacus]RCV91213.1 bifunctional adenosylcobinamide kinase/adenosylcobinamide-phosphate guanylyltransferase [Halomonas montanilacus]